MSAPGTTALRQTPALQLTKSCVLPDITVLTRSCTLVVQGSTRKARAVCPAMSVRKVQSSDYRFHRIAPQCNGA